MGARAKAGADDSRFDAAAGEAVDSLRKRGKSRAVGATSRPVSGKVDLGLPVLARSTAGPSSPRFEVDACMEKPAHTDHDVHALIRDRWSPRAFSPEPVTEAALGSLFEAARWAASCFNEQPWRFIVARRESAVEFDRLLSCVNETNRRWAGGAAVLALSVARTTFARNGKPNRHALHDVGLAAAQLTLQATALGLRVHQMAGFSLERARQLYAIPDEFEPVACLAIGRPGDPDQLPDDLRTRELAERSRTPQTEFVFAGTWGSPLPRLP